MTDVNNTQLTVVQVDELLEKLHGYENDIRALEATRDALIAHYQERIEMAKELFSEQAKDTESEMAVITEQLRRYAAANVTDRRRSIRLPGGTLSFRKSPTKFFFGDNEVNGKSSELLSFAKTSAPEFVKTVTTQSVDWAGLKTKLAVDEDGSVSYGETGEVIDGLKAQVLPDKFTVVTA